MSSKSYIYCEFCRAHISHHNQLKYLQPKIKQLMALIFLSKISNYLPNKIKNRINKVKLDQDFFGDRYQIWCSKCNMGFVYPEFSPDKLDDYYKKAYWFNRGLKILEKNKAFETQEIKAKFIELGIKKFDVFKKRAVKHLECLKKHLSFTPQSILDFGCGNAIASYYLTKQYPESKVLAFDKSEFSAHVCHSLNIPFTSQLELDSSSFDLVYSSHSIEHVPNIHQQFLQLKEIISPHGFIFFEFPNITNFHIFSKMRHTPHTYMFNQNGMKQLAGKYGFNVIYSEQYGAYWKDIYKVNSKSDMTESILILQKNNLCN